MVAAPFELPQNLDPSTHGAGGAPTDPRAPGVEIDPRQARAPRLGEARQGPGTYPRASRKAPPATFADESYALSKYTSAWRRLLLSN